LKVFEGLFISWQYVDGILHCHRPEPLEAASDLHPQVAGVRWDLVNEDEPARFKEFGHSMTVSQL
jgi:hypothetical protein